MGWWTDAKKAAGSAVSNTVRGAGGALMNAGRTVVDVAKAGGNVLTGDLGAAGKNISDAGAHTVKTLQSGVRAVANPVGGFLMGGLPGVVAGGIAGGLIKNNTSKPVNQPVPLGGGQTAPAAPTPTSPKPPEVPLYRPQKSQQDIEAEQQSEAGKVINDPNIREAKKAPDTNVKRYSLNEFNGGPANEPEQIYQDHVITGMKTGKFADVESALNRTGRENALDQSRSQMMGEAQGAQAGYQPGTAEYNRAITLSNAGASERSMGRNNAVNALQRGAVKEAMAAGKALGQEGYGRQLDARTHEEGLDAIQYNQDRTAYTDEKGMVEAYIAGLPPQAQNKARELWAKGKNPIGAGFTTATGAAAVPFRGLTEGQKEQAAVKEQWEARNPQLANESDDDYANRKAQGVAQQNKDTYQIAYNPINSATRTNQVQDSVNAHVESLAQTGKNLDASSWKTLNSTRPDLVNSIPVAESLTGTGYAKNAKKGEVVEYNGKKYMVVNPKHHPTWENFWGQTRTKDGILAIDENGNEVQIAMTEEYDPD